MTLFPDWSESPALGEMIHEGGTPFLLMVISVSVVSLCLVIRRLLRLRSDRPIFEATDVALLAGLVGLPLLWALLTAPYICELAFRTLRGNAQENPHLLKPWALAAVSRIAMLGLFATLGCTAVQLLARLRRRPKPSADYPAGR